MFFTFLICSLSPTSLKSSTTKSKTATSTATTSNERNTIKNNKVNLNNKLKLKQPNNNTVATSTTPKTYSFRITLNKCDNSNCKPEYGHCLNNSCFCNKGYANVEGKNISNSVCSYKQRKQIIAFLLELFLCFVGAGHAYIGHYSISLLKFILMVLWPLVWVCVFFDWIKDQEENEENKCTLLTLKKVIPFVYMCLLGVWVIVDLVIFGLNIFTDRNVVPLESW